MTHAAYIFSTSSAECPFFARNGLSVNVTGKTSKNRSRKGTISVEVVDPRTTSPLDTDVIVESVAHTGRLVAVDEANPMCNMASEVISVVALNALASLKAAPKKISAPHTPVPASPVLEKLYVPSVGQIEAAVREVMAA